MCLLSPSPQETRDTYFSSSSSSGLRNFPLSSNSSVSPSFSGGYGIIGDSSLPVIKILSSIGFSGGKGLLSKLNLLAAMLPLSD